EVREIVERIEDGVAEAALPRRRTHAIEEQRIFALGRRHVVIVVASVNLQPGDAALIELLEERAEPVRMLVINGDRLFEAGAISIDLIAHKTLPLASCLRVRRPELPRTCEHRANPSQEEMTTSRSSILFPSQQIRAIALGFLESGGATPLGDLGVISADE